jgi:membrane protein YqaA with SNARE-associated domain
LQTIKHIAARYTHWIWGFLAPLGPWGVFLFAAVDGSIMGLPLDAVVAGYVYANHARLLMYVVLASAGSAVGSSLIYAIGYLGGEAFLRKRIPAARYEKIHESFDKHEFWALMLPAMLPPPTPFKIFVLAAAVAEMRFTHFLAAIFAGRFVRFMVLGILTIEFGPQFVYLIGQIVRHQMRWVLIAVAVGLALWWLLWKKKRRARGSELEAER